ncbi:MAG: hypothetical protein RIR84_642, partial [Bacteroidota bacterium]
RVLQVFHVYPDLMGSASLKIKFHPCVTSQSFNYFEMRYRWLAIFTYPHSSWNGWMLLNRHFNGAFFLHDSAHCESHVYFFHCTLFKKLIVIFMCLICLCEEQQSACVAVNAVYNKNMWV